MVQAVSKPESVRGSPARVALVSGALDLGGSTTFLCNLGGELVRRGCAVQVLSFERENPLASDFTRLGVPVIALDGRRTIYEDRLRLILDELRRFQPTAALANLSATSFEVLRYVPPGVFRLGVAHADHAPVYEIIRHYASCLDLLAVVSEEIRRKMDQLPEFARVPVRYLPLGVPMPEGNPAAARDVMAPLRILYLGRVDREQKRVHLFPSIFEKLQSSGIPFHWTIAGEGGERKSLEQFMKSSRSDQTISFTGTIAYADVPHLLSEHDVFLLVSDYEGLPLTLLEAMGCGLVPVVSDLPSGIRELVDQDTGRRVAPDNLAGYAEAILWLHEHRQEKQRLSANARERVRRDFSVAAMTDRWLAALPPPPASEIRWPDRWQPKPILAAPNPWRFSPPARVLRRLWLKCFGAHDS